jgi:formate hydrogenlyase subunit 4
VALINKPGLWLLVGTALFLCSLVELSRMPVDDPTTHLELTMVHEAMILEASGRNLALLEFSHALRMTILFGLVAQCYMHAVPYLWQTTDAVRLGVSLICVLSIACFVGVLESILVKLQWVKIPNFIAYSLTMSLLAGCIAVGGGLSK